MSFSTPILNFFVSMIMLFLFAALIVTAAQEIIAQVLALRAKTLQNAIRQLIGEAGASDELTAILNHPLIKGLRPASASGSKDPSYIPSDIFAAAVMDNLKLLDSGVGLLNAVKDAAQKPGATPLVQAVAALAQGAKGDVEALQNDVARWFDAAMERATGAYKRQAQMWTLALGLLAAIAFNVDSVRIGAHFLKHPEAAQQMADEATRLVEQGPDFPKTPEGREKLRQDLQQAVAAGAVPIGWSAMGPTAPLDILSKLIGWCCTALAASLGATFWFDLLKRFVNIRSSGPNPDSDKTANRLNGFTQQT